MVEPAKNPIVQAISWGVARAHGIPMGGDSVSTICASHQVEDAKAADEARTQALKVVVSERQDDKVEDVDTDAHSESRMDSHHVGFHASESGLVEIMA